MQNSSVLSEVLNGGCLNNVDDGYFQFVVSLLDETENNPALKRELEETLGMNDDCNLLLFFFLLSFLLFLFFFLFLLIISYF